MLHGDFLMVIPPGWNEIPNATDLIVVWGEDGLSLDIQQKRWGIIDGVIEAAGFLPAGHTLVEARMFDTGAEGSSRLRFWFRTEPLPPQP